MEKRPREQGRKIKSISLASLSLVGSIAISGSHSSPELKLDVPAPIEQVMHGPNELAFLNQVITNSGVTIHVYHERMQILPLTPAQVAKSHVSQSTYAKWLIVHNCEEPAYPHWNSPGPIYPGGLGIKYTSWIANGGNDYGVSEADATPYEQIEVAERINKGYIPDQNGKCTGW